LQAEDCMQGLPSAAHHGHATLQEGCSCWTNLVPPPPPRAPPPPPPFPPVAQYAAQHHTFLHRCQLLLRVAQQPQPSAEEEARLAAHGFRDWALTDGGRHLHALRLCSLPRSQPAWSSALSVLRG
jgi:hypothetical protein